MLVGHVAFGGDAVGADHHAVDAPYSKKCLPFFVHDQRRGEVTHSEANAGYGNRIIDLADGWAVKPAEA